MQTLSDVTHTADAVVHEFFAAFGRGDRAALMALVAPDAVWHVQGAAEVPWTGHWSGHAEIGRFFAILAEQLEPRAFDVAQVVTQGRHVAAFGTLRFLVRSTGREFAGHWAIHFEVRDGRVWRYRMHEDSHAVAIAFRREA